MYHATKWAIEGWSESLAFELNKMGIGIKTVLPGAIKTDFIDRSMDTSSHPAYDGLVKQMFSNTGDHFQAGSSPEEIARVVFEAATDGKDQLRYIAGDDAKAFYAQRLEMGDEAFRKQLGELFLK
jgi:NAD(P)-dependent dehydrogenase (short-subunit alcohol dehydrogenase family)